MSIVRPRVAGSSGSPRSTRVTSSVTRRATSPASSPSMATSLPRTTTRVPGKAASINRRCSSYCPTRGAMRWFPGTSILSWVDVNDPPGRPEGPSVSPPRPGPARVPPRFDAVDEEADGDALVADLTRYLAEQRADAAAASRAREHWLRQAAAEEAMV